MNKNIESYIKKYSEEIQALFLEVRELIIKSVSCELEEKLWAKLPSFYIDDKFVRLIPFKNHINIEAAAIIDHKSQLQQYKITPKGMLQIYLNQNIPYDILQTVFKESLLK